LDALHLLTGDAQAFVEKVWASHIHLHHADPGALVALLSLDDVDHLLTSTALRAPALRIVKDGSVLPDKTFTREAALSGQPLTGLVDARKVLDLFESGASVVLQGLHRYWPPLTGVVRELELALGHAGQANAYLTPPGSQGFAVHSDSHDVIVVQTHGTKRWELHDESGAREVLLEPGTCMYLPAGTPHAARAQDTASLHVTIGLHPTTWRDVIRRVTNDVLEDERYDEPLPAGYLAEPTAFTHALDEHLAAFRREVAETEAGQVLADQTTRFLTRRSSALRGGLRDRLEVARICDQTTLERRPATPCVLVAAGDKLRVLLGDRELRVPIRLEEPLRYVAAQTTLTPSELSPWLDPQSRLVLTRRLVREGLLRVVV